MIYKLLMITLTALSPALEYKLHDGRDLCFVHGALNSAEHKGPPKLLTKYSHEQKGIGVKANNSMTATHTCTAVTIK